MVSPLSQIIPSELTPIRLIATDMDGTLTVDGKFTPALLESLQKLATANITVLIVTGRSAGWVNGIVSYLPIVGAIAENGCLFYPQAESAPVMLVETPDIEKHRQNLAIAFQALKSKFPGIEESTDNRFRICDWTFDIGNLTIPDLQILESMCSDMGWGFTYSSVQCHIKPPAQDKAKALLQVLKQYFPQYSPRELVTVGDSPNDESLFNPDKFPISVGVANISEYTNQLKYQPKYITNNLEGKGFCELTQSIISTTYKDKI
ncbi:MAG: HAD family hydrolase [Cyanobacteria bacterium P01_A01_bin.45]